MLKSLNISELDELTVSLGRWLGAQVQEILGNERDLGLFLWKEGTGLWFWVDLTASNPLVLLSEKKPPVGKRLKPLHLFLRANFANSILQEVVFDKEKGRVLVLKTSKGELELRLFPHGQNAIATCGKKSISWSPVKELGAVQAVEGEVRDDILGKWWNERFEKRVVNKADPLAVRIKKLRNDLKKKKRALEKLEDEISSGGKDWQKAGEWLQAFGSVDFPEKIPPEFDFLDKEMSLSENIQNCFARVKKQKAKLEGRSERMDVLKREVLQIEELLADPKKIKIEAPQVSLLERTKSTGRTKVLSPQVTAYLGRSAKDNLQLLRGAKPWFIWLHLRDFPGAHAIVQCPKKWQVEDKLLLEVAEWVVEQSFAKKEMMAGEKVSVVFCECRYVKPIKGDRLGRVNFRNESTLFFQYKSKS